MVYLMGAVFFLTALLPTFVLSRVLLVFFWRADCGAPTIAACHVGSYLFCVLVGALGFAAGGAVDGGSKVGLAALSFMLPQFLWMVSDIYKFEKKTQIQAQSADTHRVRMPAPVALLPPPEHFRGRNQAVDP